ncbi:uncharacterized protein LOC119736188 [Patiria miniata]|uniref:SnoaL-like domain-containing protein n=1 Tax=Patiria miniata TaxID=46514 RepID=A0A914ARY2_PATMI|nr:uncharacterized protein LOC119736188 [Patiria miniata]
MFRTASLCALLICGLMFASATKVNDIAVEEWTEERVEAMMNAKAAAVDKTMTYEEVREEVDYMSHLYSKYVRDNNCGAIINLYDPAVMLIDHDAPIVNGIEAIQFVLAALEGVGSMNMTTLSVAPLGKDARFVFQHVLSKGFDREGNFMHEGHFFMIWKRHATGLRIHMEIYDMAAMTLSDKHY